MAWARAALGVAAAVAAGLVLVSGGSGTDPRTPVGLPGMPPPFLGTTVAGSGGLTAAVDAYGDVVDLRAPGPASRALIENPAARQATGTVSADTGIVPRVRIGRGPALPLWRADSVSQRYLAGTSAVRTVARFGGVAVTITDAALGRELVRVVKTSGPAGIRAVPSLGVNVEGGVRCEREAKPGAVAMICGAPRPPARGAAEDRVDSLGGPAAPSSPGARAGIAIRAAVAADRAWIRRAQPLAPAAPAWATRLYERSLLVLRALTDRRSGAVAAGARDGWAYAWPRDGATAALAFTAAGYRAEARRVVGFLVGLDLDAAARFHGDGTAVAGRGPQGDVAGWVRAAAEALGMNPALPASPPDAADYQEGDGGSYLGNALAAIGGERTRIAADAGAPASPVETIREEFETPRGLVRRAGNPASGLDSAAAWAVRPFSMPPLYPAARRTLLRLEAAGTRYGITPGEGWAGGVDPWTAPTAWSAWSLAALAASAPAGSARGHADRRAALRLLADLRRAATPAGALPERVDARTGIPRSTTPLAWPHAFAILALRKLWPSPRVWSPFEPLCGRNGDHTGGGGPC